MSRSTEPRRARRRALGAIAAVALGLAGALLPVAAAQAGVALVLTVTDQFGTALAGVDVEIYEDSPPNAYVGNDLTDTSGQVTFDLTADQTYTILIGNQLLPGGREVLSDDFTVTQPSTGSQNYTAEVDVTSVIGGTIANWDDAMDPLYVVAFDDALGDWDATLDIALVDEGEFELPLLMAPGVNYTLYFALDLGNTTPYVSAFLGGGIDPAAAPSFVGGSGPFPTTMTMPAATYVSGIVTDLATTSGLQGIDITAISENNYSFASAETDVDGRYTLKVHPAATYAIYAEHPTDDYLPMTFDEIFGCGCLFTPVTGPRSDVDFQMVQDGTELYLLGDVHEPPYDPDPSSSGDPIDDVVVHVYRAVTGGWKEIGTYETDSLGEFDAIIPRLASYRLRFELNGDWLEIEDGEAGPSTGSPSRVTPACFLDTGAMASGWVDTDRVAYYAAVTLVAGACGPEPIPGVPGSGGSGTPNQPTRPRTSSATSVIVAPTPTPTPTASATPTPRPTASPTPSATPTPEPAPASAPDLWWLLWLLLGIVVVVVIGVVVLLVRRV